MTDTITDVDAVTELHRRHLHSVQHAMGMLPWFAMRLADGYEAGRPDLDAFTDDDISVRARLAGSFLMVTHGEDPDATTVLDPTLGRPQRSRHVERRPAPTTVTVEQLATISDAMKALFDVGLGDVYRDDFDECPAVWEVAMATKLANAVLVWARQLAQDVAGIACGEDESSGATNSAEAVADLYLDEAGA